MSNRHDDLSSTPGDDEGRGLPPELEEMLRGLTGGGPLDPRLSEMLQGMGLDKVDPGQLSMMVQQVQAMFTSGPDDGSVNAELARDTARKTVSAAGDAVPSERSRAEAGDAVSVAGLWLDAVTEVTASGLRGVGWSRAEWVEATMPVWVELVEPVAEGVAHAVGEALTAQLGELAGGEGMLPPGLLPPGMEPAAMMAQMGPMMRRVHGSLFSVQLGQAVGTLAGEVLTGCEVSLPLTDKGTVALLPAAVVELASGLELDETQVRLYLAVRESARARLFADVPWLASQLLAAVRDYAADITIDTDAIEEGVRSIDHTDPEAVQRALEGKLFAQKHSPAQAAALARLETWLALVEGWVDVVTAEAVRGHLPQADALGEAVRRRRASGGPAEKTFATLVGLELRPRRLRDAANLFHALQASGGAAARDAAWAHPDLAPGPADLDDPLGYVERRASSGPDALDAELDALLRGQPGPETPGPTR